MAIATLSVDLVAKLAKFEADMGKAARASEKTANQISGALNSIKVAAGALAGVVSVGLFANMIRGTLDAADKLGKLSQRTGIAVETLGGLGYAATLAGGDIQSLSSAADKLNKSIAEAAAGEKQASEAFAALGLSAKDAAGNTKSVDVVMAELADKFASYADGPEKVAIAMRLMGKAGAEQIVLLNQGGDALRSQSAEWQRYSGVTTQLTKDSELFNDTLTRIGLVSGSLATTVTVGLLPGMQALADEFLRARDNGTGFGVIADGIRIAFESIVIVGANVVFVLQGIYREFVAIGKQIIALGRLDLKGFSAISDAVKADGVRARAELDALERRILGIGRIDPNDQSAAESRRLGLTSGVRKPSAPRLASSASSGGGAKASKVKVDKELDLTNKELERYLENLEKTIQKSQDLSAVEEARIFLSKQAGSVSADDAARLLNLARQIDATHALNDANKAALDFARELAQEEERASSARQSKLDGLLSNTQTNIEKERTENIRLLTEAYNKGAIATKQFYEALALQMDVVEEKIEKQKTLAEELGLTFVSAFEDAIVGGKSLSDVLKGLEKDILRIVTRKMVTEPLGNALNGALSGGGGFLSGIFNSIFGGFKANGGPVMAGTPYMVGERGPELFVPRSSGSIVPNNRMGGNTVSVTVNQSFGASTSRATSLQAAADASRALQQAGRNL